MRRRAVAVLAGVLTSGLAACSSGEEPATAAPSTPDVCASAEDLQTSLSALQDVRVRQDGIAAVESSWATVQDDWTQLGDDARATHADRVAAVQAAADDVRNAVAEAGDAPSAATLRAVGEAVRSFGTEAGALLDEVGTTC
jgi:hypothetical protein